MFGLKYLGRLAFTTLKDGEVIKQIKKIGVIFETTSFTRGMLAGSKDEFTATFTDSEMTIAHDMARQLNKCKPWEDHLDETTVRLFREALNREDYELARSIIDAGGKDTAAPWCLDLLKTVVVHACQKCPTILKEALPTTYMY